MFLIYTIIPFVLEISSAAFLNVNLLTADFYSVLVGILMKQYKVKKLIFFENEKNLLWHLFFAVFFKLHYLYFIGLISIVIGTILYSLHKPRMRDNNQNNVLNEIRL